MKNMRILTSQLSKKTNGSQYKSFLFINNSLNHKKAFIL